MSQIIITNNTNSPSAPSSGQLSLFAKSDRLYTKTSAGTETALGCTAASGTDIVTGTDDTKFVTAKALRDAGVITYEIIGGVIYHKALIQVGSLRPTMTNGCAASAQIEMSTNKNVYDYLAFDKDTIEYAYANIEDVPYEYTGGKILAKAIWTHPPTTTNFKVSWGFQLGSAGDGDNLDFSFGTAVYSNDTGGSGAGSSYLHFVSPITSGITPSGTPAADKLLNLKVQRKANDATNDTLAVDAYLLGVMLYYPVV